MKAESFNGSINNAEKGEPKLGHDLRDNLCTLWCCTVVFKFKLLLSKQSRSLSTNRNTLNASFILKLPQYGVWMLGIFSLTRLYYAAKLGKKCEKKYVTLFHHFFFWIRGKFVKYTSSMFVFCRLWKAVKHTIHPFGIWLMVMVELHQCRKTETFIFSNILISTTCYQTLTITFGVHAGVIFKTLDSRILEFPFFFLLSIAVNFHHFSTKLKQNSETNTTVKLQVSMLHSDFLMRWNFFTWLFTLWFKCDGHQTPAWTAYGPEVIHCNYGLLWSSGCYLFSEVCVDAILELGVVGLWCEGLYWHKVHQ